MSFSRLKQPAFLVSLALLLGSAATLSATIKAFKVYTRKEPIEVALKCSSVPKETPTWAQVGQDHLETAEVLDTLGTQNYLTRLYVSKPDAKISEGGAKSIQLHLAYYTGMVDTVPHVPDRCFVGAGIPLAGGPFDVPVKLDRSQWLEDLAASSDTEKETGEKGVKIYTVRLGPNSKSPGNRVRLPRGIENLQMRVFQFKEPGKDQMLHAGYFFIANGGLTNTAQNVRLLAFDLKSYYAFYQKVQVSSPNVKSPEELAELAARLFDELLPDIMLTVPDWTEVIRGNYPADNPRGKAARESQN